MLSRCTIIGAMVKKLTFEEFNKRTQEVLKAQKIFGEFTNNISVAFAMYQDILADEEMSVFISTLEGGKRTMTMIDDYVRPRCPECNTELRLRVNPVDANGKPWETAWVCTECQAEFYSEKTVPELMAELKKVEREDV